MALSTGEIFVLGRELIEEFLNEIKQELIDYLDTEDRNATGRSKASLQVVNMTDTSGQLVGSDGIEYVFRGRGPGKMPPIWNIIEWCAARGLPRSAAWAIAKRISEAGTRLYQSGRNVLDEIITEQRINDFTDRLTKIYTAEIETEIESILKAS